MMRTSSTPASFSRAPVTRPAKPPPMNATVTWSVLRLALDDRRVRVVEVVGELVRQLEVLVVAVGPQPLVALLGVLLLERVLVDRGRHEGRVNDET